GLRIWQPVTYLFLHDAGTIWHLVTNMFMLWMFGRELEIVWGRERFLRYYFLTGVGAGLINLIVQMVPLTWGRPPSDIPTIGASGAIFGVLLACAVLFPDRRVTLFPIPIQMSMRTFMIVMIVLEFLGTFGVGGDDISHFCHFGGMLVGYIYLRRGGFFFNPPHNPSALADPRNPKALQGVNNKPQKEPPSRPQRRLNS